eukprot:Pompholyxophrys_sp_v1_NODE_13_length_4899_cov_11.419162.p1 type:complete len:182 gc:universal NODE_13_length_4899_cov_11.419162:2949-3494(+)
MSITRAKTEDMSDIHDGFLYKQNPIVSTYGNLSIGLSVDGLPLFHRSKQQLWPLLMVVYDLPPEERCKFKNMSILGLYFGTEKPDINEYLKPVIECIRKSQSGQMIINGEARRLSVSTFAADLPAKAIFLNSLQYNGAFGCHNCLQEGLYEDHRRVWPFEEVMPRTHQNMLQHAQEAFLTS